MQKLTKNRLIGSSVLLFAGMLFVPRILTPEAHDLTNPTLAIRIDSDNPLAKPSQSVALDKPITQQTDSSSDKPITSVPQQPPVRLESIDTGNVGKQNHADHANNTGGTPQKGTTKQSPAVDAAITTISKQAVGGSTKAIPIVLESIATDAGEFSNKPSSQKVSGWVRVGSFASQVNANKLIVKLKSHYSVKTERVNVAGKVYHRVLVGPFTSEKQLQAAMKRIHADGFKPSIQR